MKDAIPDDIFIAETKEPREKQRIVILTTDGTEDQEFFYPYYRFLEAGYSVDVITPDGKEFKGKNGAGLKTTMKISDADHQDYALLYIPGGKAPAKLKKEDSAVEFVRAFCGTGKPVGAICHGPQLLAEANVIEGFSIAAWPECEDEVTKAGAQYKNEACVQDGPFITGRWPADLPHQVGKIIEILKAGAGSTRLAA